MDSPQNHIWGPHLWQILHYSTERITQPHLNPQEETRLWTNFLSSLRFSLPCPQCKKHYTAYYSSTPLTTIHRNSVRTWLYNLHCQVNDRIGKPNMITIDKLPEIYSQPFNFSYHYNIVIQEMHKALRLGWSSRDDIQRTIRFLQEIKRFYDFF
jgi:hypothetical protein